MADERNKRIRFINTKYRTLFYVNDGEAIEIDVEGIPVRYSCHYIDDYHTKIGGHCFHNYQFAEMMERNNRTFRPAGASITGDVHDVEGRPFNRDRN